MAATLRTGRQWRRVAVAGPGRRGPARGRHRVIGSAFRTRDGCAGCAGRKIQAPLAVERRRTDVEKAMELYHRGYSKAADKQPPDHDQAYYHGINLAYLELAYGGDYHAAREQANAVLEHCKAAVSPKDGSGVLPAPAMRS